MLGPIVLANHGTFYIGSSGFPSLTSKGEAVSFAVSDSNDAGALGDKLTGFIDSNNNGQVDPGDRLVFTLTLENNGTASGNYEFTLLDQLDHPAGLGENTLTIDFSGVIRFADADGDTITLTPNSFTIDVIDDTPIVNGQTTISRAVDEDSLSTTSSNPGPDLVTGNLDASNDGDETQFSQALLQTLVKPGADEDVTFSLVNALSGNVRTTAGANVLSGGKNVVWGIDATGVFGFADVNGSNGFDGGDTIIFRLTQSSPGGAITFDLQGRIDHLTGATGSGDDQILTLNLTPAFLAQDFDHDFVTLNANSIKITIEDDLPIAVSSDTGTVDEDDLTGANHPGNNDSASGDDFLPGTSTSPSFAGSFGINFGADGPANSGAISSVMLTNAVKSDGVAVGSNLIQVGNEWFGRAVSRDVFKISFDTSTGKYTFTLLDNIDHPAVDIEDNLQLNFSFVAKDFDLDTTNGSFSVIVDDDMPVAPQSSAQNLIVNGDFVGGTFQGQGDFPNQQNWGANNQGGIDTNGIEGWTVSGSGGQIERVGNNYLGMVTSNENPMIDMAASPGNIEISQTVNGLTTGQTYVIAFEAGAPVPSSASLEVYWNGVLISTINPTGPMTKYELIVTGAGTSGALSFKEVGLDNGDSVSPTPGTSGHHGTYLANISLVAAPTAVVDEDGLNNPPQAVGIGDIQIGDAPTNSATIVKQALGILWGADNNDQTDGASQDPPDAVADRSLKFANANVTVGGAATLSSNGDAVSFALVDNDTRLVGYVNSGGVGYTPGERLVFEVSLYDDETGSFTFTLRDNIDHAPNANENDVTLSFNYVAKDSDGDTATGSFVVSVDDDMPIVGLVALQGAEIRLDETNGGGGVNQADDTTSDGFLAQVTVNGSALFVVNPLADFGADGPLDANNDGVADVSAKVFSLDLGNDNSGLVDTATGLPITLSLNGTSIEGKVGGDVVFTIGIDAATGNVTVTQYRAIQHDDPADHDESSSPASLLAGSVSIRVTLTDDDNDTATNTVELGSLIKFEDDGPTMEGKVCLVSGNGLPAGADASDLLYAIPPGVGLTVDISSITAVTSYQDSIGYYFADANGNPIGGAILSDYAGNPNTEQPGNPGDSSALITIPASGVPAGAVMLGFFLIPNGNVVNPSLIDGAAVTFAPNGTEWTVLVGGNPLLTADGQGGHVAFSDHRLNINDLDKETGPGVVLTKDSNWEDLFAGSDQDFNDVSFNVEVCATPNILITVDEDGLQNAALDGFPTLRPGETNGSENAVAIGAAGAITALVNFGSDGPHATHAISLAVAGPSAPIGLKSQGGDIVIFSDGTTLTGYVDNGDAGFGSGDRTVFTLTVTSGGGYTFTLKDQIDHPDTLGGDNTENLLQTGIDLSSYIIARDGDNDTIPLAADTFKVQILDDIPVQTSNTVTGKVDEDELTLLNSNNQWIGNPDEPVVTNVVTGSLTSLVTVGVDEPGSFSLIANPTGLTAITSKGDTVLYSVSGTVLTGYVDSDLTPGISVGDRVVFTLDVQPNGIYTFTLKDQIDHLPNIPANTRRPVVRASRPATARCSRSTCSRTAPLRSRCSIRSTTCRTFRPTTTIRRGSSISHRRSSTPTMTATRSRSSVRRPRRRSRPVLACTRATTSRPTRSAA